LVIDVVTSDSIIWNKDDVLLELSHAMATNMSSIAINLISEGPCLQSLGLYKLLELYAIKFNYDLKNIKVFTCNNLESHPTVDIQYKPPMHLMNNAWDQYIDIPIRKNISKYVGIFIGKSNWQRLHISSYLSTYYNKQTLMSYRYDRTDDYYRNNIGLENIIQHNNSASIVMEANFLDKCPVLLDNATKIRYIKDIPENLSQQLDVTNDISNYYNDFFVEMVCETYFTGNTFFPTEKIWRPILLKTPFIIQGPKYYLRYLQDLGFNTFSDWWDEGYDADPDIGRLESIKQNIDWIMQQDTNTIARWYFEMDLILEHNYNRLQELKNEQ